MDNKILLVGGTFDDNEGKQSKIIDKISRNIECICINGGNYNNIEKIIKHIGEKQYDIVFWFPNIPNNLPKLRNLKELYPKIMLVTSKRNNNEYSKKEIIAKALRDKANLILEFNKLNNPFNMRISDPLGNEFYNGTDIEEMCIKLLNRITFLKTITRKSVLNSGLEVDYFLIEEKFLKIIKKYAEKFHSLINPMETNRYLGNASKRFRCEKGFPSKRLENGVLVSRRNISKEHIQTNEFVEVYEENEMLYYKGDKKPSVDTPIQFELYKKLPEVNYMIHSHVYVKNAPFTQHKLPCGALEEIDEIMKVIKENNLKTNFCINLIGHGCTIFAKDLDYFDKIEFIERKI